MKEDLCLKCELREIKKEKPFRLPGLSVTPCKHFDQIKIFPIYHLFRENRWAMSRWYGRNNEGVN